MGTDKRLYEHLSVMPESRQVETKHLERGLCFSVHPEPVEGHERRNIASSVRTERVEVSN